MIFIDDLVAMYKVFSMRIYSSHLNYVNIPVDHLQICAPLKPHNQAQLPAISTNPPSTILWSIHLGAYSEEVPPYISWGSTSGPEAELPPTFERDTHSTKSLSRRGFSSRLGTRGPR